MRNKPTIIVNIAASPFYYGKPEKRIKMFSEISKKFKIPYIYVNQVGANDDLVFDGHSMFITSKGELNASTQGFAEQTLIVNTENEKCEKIKLNSNIENIYSALVLGIKDYFKKCGLKNTILGISGGIDSAIVAVLAVHALGSENVRGIAMPSQYSTDHSLKDAKDLMENINSKLDIIQIKEIFNNYVDVLTPYFENKGSDITEENLQARIRGNYLMAFSNKLGNLVLTTGNKSEISVGYCTMYGDMCGGLNPIGDLYKTTVYELAKYINRDEEIIPWNIITKEPSAELRPDQKDSDSLPPYEILDGILKYHLEDNLEEEDIVKKGFNEKLVKRILWLFRINEHKRKQYAPILKVSKRSFGQGWRMPIAKK
jgi:NAD+ synthase (glutamine-hydrolysing)